MPWLNRAERKEARKLLRARRARLRANAPPILACGGCGQRFDTAEELAAHELDCDGNLYDLERDTHDW